MAINIATRYPGQSAAPSAAYPLGSGQDVTVPGDGTGTPLELNMMNDIWGLLQKLLGQAGITASNLPDTVLVSQYYDSLLAILGQITDYIFLDETDMAAGTTILGESVTFVSGQTLRIQKTGGLVRFFVVTGSSTAPNISLGSGLYAEELYSNYKSGTVDAEVRTPYSDTLEVFTWNWTKVGPMVSIVTGDMFVHSTANDEFVISPPTATGVWPAELVATTAQYIPVVGTVELLNGWQRPAFLGAPASASGIFGGAVTDTDGYYRSDAWGFNQTPPKGIFKGVLQYSTD